MHALKTALKSLWRALVVLYKVFQVILTLAAVGMLFAIVGAIIILSRTHA